MNAFAILIAFSFASAPPSVKNVFSSSPGHSVASFWPSSARASYTAKGVMYGSFSPCFVIASITRLSPWPMLTPINWLLKSR